MHKERACEMCSHCQAPVAWESWAAAAALSGRTWRRIGRCDCGSRIQLRTSPPPQSECQPGAEELAS